MRTMDGPHVGLPRKGACAGLIREIDPPLKLRLLIYYAETPLLFPRTKFFKRVSNKGVKQGSKNTPNACTTPGSSLALPQSGSPHLPARCPASMDPSVHTSSSLRNPPSGLPHITSGRPSHGQHRWPRRLHASGPAAFASRESEVSAHIPQPERTTSVTRASPYRAMPSRP
jgi:hypothetical protein